MHHLTKTITTDDEYEQLSRCIWEAYYHTSFSCDQHEMHEIIANAVRDFFYNEQ